MVFNGDGKDNAAIGYFSRYNYISGNSNSALGTDTLISNTSGDCNTTLGDSAQLIVPPGQQYRHPLRRWQFYYDGK